MEQAIITHASALLALAEAIKSMSGGGPLLLGHLGAQPIGTAEVDGDKVTIKGNTARESIQAALDAAKAGTKGKKETPKPTPAPTEAPEPEPEAGNDETTTGGESDAGAGSGDDALELDYVKDVRPKLLDIIKKVGKEKVKDTIAKFGVEKAENLDPAKLPALLAACEKLVK